MLIDSETLKDLIKFHDYSPCVIDENANNAIWQIIHIISDLENNSQNIT